MTRRPAWPEHNADDGMTLVEVLIVLAIIGLTYALVAPNFTSTAKSVAVRTIALDLKNQLAVARAVAIARNRSVAVILDLKQRRYASEADNRWVQWPADLQVSVTTARDTGDDGGLPRLVFFPDGSASGGQVVIGREKQSYTVVVEWLNGHPRIELTP